MIEVLDDPVADPNDKRCIATNLCALETDPRFRKRNMPQLSPTHGMKHGAVPPV